MKRAETIKNQKLFNYIIKNGNYIKNSYFVLYSSKKEEPEINFGIAISNKVGKAHIRNKLKRQVRSIIENNRNLFKNNNNYIIMIRRSCTEVKYSELESALVDLLKKQG